MSESTFWDTLFADYAAARESSRRGKKPEKPFEPDEQALQRYVAANDVDLQWIRKSLLHDQRKWLVGDLANRTRTVPETLFAPMLDAGIDEVDPSFNRYFVEPCMLAFGPRRVNEYLLDVAENGTNRRRAGAINAMYWAEVPLDSKGFPPRFTLEHATPESRERYVSLKDIRSRRRALYLRTFVFNTNLDVRRSVIPGLNLDPDSYSEEDRPLVEKAIRIARESDDEYIRHRIEVQLGNATHLGPLPHRQKSDT